MARHCITCRHPRRADIESAVHAHQSVRSVAGDFKLTVGALRRHLRVCVPKSIAAGVSLRNGNAGLTLLSRIQESHAQLKEILDRAKGTNELTVAVNAIQGGLRALELEGRVTGEISAGGTHVNVLLGVRIEDAKRSVETVASAQAMPAGEVAERALRCLERMSLSTEQAERMRLAAERALRVSESGAEVIE